MSCLEMSLNVSKCQYMSCLEMSRNVSKCLTFTVHRSFRPTNSGDTTLEKTSNRTYKQATIDSCEAESIHKRLWTAPTSGEVPPWVFDKADCIKADRRMKSIIGPPGIRRIAHVMKAGKGENTHDTLEWAFTFARWCWSGLGNRVYVENALDIFDVLNILTASTMKIETVCLISKCLKMSRNVYFCMSRNVSKCLTSSRNVLLCLEMSINVY